MTDLKREYKQSLAKYAAEYKNIQTVRLGNFAHVVQTGTNGILWARQIDGKVIEVINRAMVPADFDLRVLVGIYKTQPGKFVILQVMQDYLVPADGGRIGYHHLQHELGQPDEVAISRKQIIAFTVRPYSGFSVLVYGGYFRSSTGYGFTPSEIVDLTDAIPPAGARYVGIHLDDTGDILVATGTNVESIEVLAYSDVPVPDVDEYPVATVLLYEGQAQIEEQDISVPMPLTDISKTMAQQIHGASADTPDTYDEWGFWDYATSTLKKILWVDLLATLQTAFDSLYAALFHTHPASDVTIVDAGDFYTSTNVEDALQEIGGGGGGGGGGAMTYDDVSAQAGSNPITLTSTPVGEVMLFYNTTFQSMDAFTVVGDQLTTDFTTSAGDIIVAVYGLGAFVEPSTSPALRVYKQQNFTM